MKVREKQFVVLSMTFDELGINPQMGVGPDNQFDTLKEAIKFAEETHSKNENISVIIVSYHTQPRTVVRECHLKCVNSRDF